MKLISHRGNLEGLRQDENHPNRISEVLDLGFDVEIDVWYIDNSYFLGHDGPQYEVEESFTLQYGLWVHAKNIEALSALKNLTNCFFHDVDAAVLTSKNFIWTYPGKRLVKNSIAVLPETTSYKKEDLKVCYGICSDFIKSFKGEYHD